MLLSLPLCNGDHVQLVLSQSLYALFSSARYNRYVTRCLSEHTAFHSSPCTPRSERRLEAALQMTKNTLYADQFDRLPLHRAKTERRDEYRAYKQQKERVLEVIYFIRGGSDAQIEREVLLRTDGIAS